MAIILALFIFLFSSVLPVHAESPDKINNFHSDITINKDTSISIKETIRYTTAIAKHGIFRTIPYRYQNKSSTYTANINDVSVTSNNTPILFTQSRENNNIILKIGDPNKTFIGDKTYEISYKMENALLKNENRIELYLDITGEYWQIPILKSSAIIRSPFADISSINCFTGPINGDDKKCIFSQSPKTEAEFLYNSTIDQNKNFTISILLNPNNSIIFPKYTSKYFLNILKTLLTLIPLILLITYWYFKGRDIVPISGNVFNLDPKQAQKLKPLLFYTRTPFVYEPLSITPGEAGLVIDKRVDNQDIIAEIIDLARKKYLKIVLVPKKGFFSKTDYDFILLKKSDQELPKHQKFLLDSIFKDSKQILLSKLKDNFAKDFQKTKTLLYQSATTNKWFTNNPSTITVLSVIYLVLSTIFVFIIKPNFLFLYLIIALFFIFKLSQRTVVGYILMMQARGLQKTIRLGLWRETIKEKHLFIEEILPFAISLGVVKKLANDMAVLGIAPPAYFNSFIIGNSNFYSSLNSFSSSINSTIVTHSYSSTGSTGGGFSGGGFGGGGGGSW